MCKEAAMIPLRKVFDRLEGFSDKGTTVHTSIYGQHSLDDCLHTLFVAIGFNSDITFLLELHALEYCGQN